MSTPVRTFSIHKPTGSAQLSIDDWDTLPAGRYAIVPFDASAPAPAQAADLIQQLRGRAQFLRDQGRVKSPDLMDRAAALASKAAAPPIEVVTPAMIQAGADAARRYMDEAAGNSPEAIYRAMRAVAPAAVAAEPNQSDTQRLAEAIAGAALKAGIYNGEVSLTVPHLIMLCGDLAASAAPTAAAAGMPAVHPAITECLRSLAAEEDAAWTPAAHTALVKLTTLVRMHGAVPAPASGDAQEDGAVPTAGGLLPCPHCGSAAALQLALKALESCGAGAVEDGGRQWFDDKLVDAAHEAIEAIHAAARNPSEGGAA